jgi:hypothetical protein
MLYNFNLDNVYYLFCIFFVYLWQKKYKHMKKLCSLICLWSLAGLLTTAIQAQVWGPKSGGVVYRISPNGRYVTGMTLSSEGSGFVWDTQSGDFETLGVHVYPYGITDNKFVAGNFEEHGKYREAGADGWSELPSNEGNWVWQVTPDGQTVAGYANKRGVYGSDYVSSVPYCWSRTDGGEWTGTEWPHPDSIKQGCIRDISDDGRTAVGYVNPATNRIAILWKSPDKYEMPFSLSAYSEYLCISKNGKYAGFSYNAGKDTPHAGIHNLETGEITFIREGFRVNAVDDNGFAFGVYRPSADLDRPFIWSKTLGFMDFGDFVSTCASESEQDTIKSTTALWRALTNKAVTFSVNAVTPDGWTFALCLQSGIDGKVYVLKIAPVTVYPFPKNLTATVPPVDRNKVILTWDAPETGGDTPTGYAIYRREQQIATVDSDTLTYIDENIPTPGYYNYRVTAVYNNGKHSNFSNSTQAMIIDNYTLPLIEKFDKLNLTSNYWTAETSPDDAPIEWNVYSDTGVESGTGLTLTANNLYGFHSQEFSASLTSKYLDGTNADNIFLSYLVRPDYYMEEELTPDTLLIDVHDGNGWVTVDKYVFKLSMEWKAEIADLSEAVAGKLFRVRFRVTGANHTVSQKIIDFDDITVAMSPPAGNAVPQNILSEAKDGSVRVAWKNPHTNRYALTYANSPKRFSIGNAGKNFIAANHFSAEELSIYKGKYLTSVTVYVNKKVSSPAVATTLKLAVFVDGQRVVDQTIDGFTPNAWNTFPLDAPIVLNGQDLKFGIEVTAHDAGEEPIGVDGTRRPANGKGDLYSENDGQTWNTLTDAGKLNNWSIIGDVADAETGEAMPATDIVGYNVYADGVKLNDDLVFGQSFVTDISGKFYTVRAYSLATGLSAESESASNLGIIALPETQRFPEIYPNPVKDILFIRSETQVKSLTVYDLFGRICKQAEPGAAALSTAGLNSGLYLVGIQTASGEFIRKIVVRGRNL